MRVLFYGVKGAGHVNPTLPVVRALVAAGHDVHYSLTEEWEEKVEAAGATFHNVVGSGPFTTANYHSGPFPFQLVPAAAAIAPRLLEEARDIAPDVVVHDSAAIWGRLVAKGLGCPSVASVTTLVIDDFAAAGLDVDAIDADELNRKAAAEIREGFGVDLSWKTIDWFYGEDSLVFSCASLNPSASSFETRFHFVGSPFAGVEAERELAAHDLSHVSGDRRLVYVAFGTIVIRMLELGADFFRPFIDAVSDREDTDLVISVGDSVDLESFGPLPESVTVRPFIPQVALLSHTDVFVTHAGSNSMHEGLLHGVPLVCVPFGSDQNMNGALVERIGAGVVLPREDVTERSVRDALERVTNDPGYRASAQRIGAELAAAGGAARAVEVLERVARGGD